MKCGVMCGGSAASKSLVYEKYFGVRIVRSTLFHCLFSTYIRTYICAWCTILDFFSVHYSEYIVCGTRELVPPHTQAHIFSPLLHTLLHPLPLAPPCSHHNPIFPLCALYPFPLFSSPNLYLLPAPPILHCSTTPPPDLALGRNCSLFLWSPFATGPLCTCRAGVCLPAGLTTPTTSGGECLQFWQHGWPLHCAHRIHNSVTSQ